MKIQAPQRCGAFFVLTATLTPERKPRVVSLKPKLKMLIHR